LGLAGGGWQWRWPNGRRLDFAGRGRLVRIASVNGDLLLLRYRAGRLAEVTDRGRRKLRLRWRGTRLVAIEAPGFARAAYGFDDAGRLVSARTPGRGFEQYWYEDHAAPHRLTGAGASQEERSRFAYDASGRVVQSRATGASAAAVLWFE